MSRKMKTIGPHELVPGAVLWETQPDKDKPLTNGDVIMQKYLVKRAMERLAAIGAPVYKGQQVKQTVDVKGLSKRQAAVLRRVRFLQRYLNTYDFQGGFLDYTDGTLLNDFMYAIGVAMWGKGHEMAGGFKRTKAKIAKFLADEAAKETT